MLKIKPCLTNAHLKQIALTCMIIDHLAAALIARGYLLTYWQNQPQIVESLIGLYPILRNIGRIAFPLYLFTLVEGYHHTHSFKRYLERLLLLAFISEIPFDLVLSGKLWDWSHQNIFFELSLCLLLFVSLDHFKNQPLWRILILATFALIAHLFAFDYGWKGIVAASIIFVAHGQRLRQALSIIPAFFFEYNMPMVFLSAPIVYLYNGQRGKQHSKFYYWIYPGHLLILFLLQQLLKY